MKETIPHVAHASTLIQLIKDLVHEIKEIHLEDGKVGWVPASAIEVI